MANGLRSVEEKKGRIGYRVLPVKTIIHVYNGLPSVEHFRTIDLCTCIRCTYCIEPLIYMYVVNLHIEPLISTCTYRTIDLHVCSKSAYRTIDLCIRSTCTYRTIDLHVYVCIKSA